MGTLKYAILGLLNRKNMTGYDLSKEFETTLFEFWNAKHSQIYPELKSLSENGLVRYEVEITGNVLAHAIASTAAAPPSRWPVMDLVEDTLYQRMNSACSSSFQAHYPRKNEWHC